MILNVISIALSSFVAAWMFFDAPHNKLSTILGTANLCATLINVVVVIGALSKCA